MWLYTQYWCICKGPNVKSYIIRMHFWEAFFFHKQKWLICNKCNYLISHIKLCYTEYTTSDIRGHYWSFVFFSHNTLITDKTSHWPSPESLSQLKTSANNSDSFSRTVCLGLWSTTTQVTHQWCSGGRQRSGPCCGHRWAPWPQTGTAGHECGGHTGRCTGSTRPLALLGG